MDKKSSPNERQAPDETERALIFVLVTALLQHYDESLEGKPHRVPGLEEVVPHFWITMARGAAVLAAQESEKNQEADDETTSLARRWLHNGVTQSYIADTLHPAGQILMKLGHLGLTVTEEEVSGNDDQRFFEEASILLADAARISPGRHDILADLCQALTVRASLGSAGSAVLLRDALKRSGEALASFPEADRYVAKTRKLHPTYGSLLSIAGTLHWLAATKTNNAKKKRALLEEACRLMRLAMEKGDIDSPELRMAHDRAADELAELPPGPAGAL
jgi:hypothetical protein